VHKITKKHLAAVKAAEKTEDSEKKASGVDANAIKYTVFDVDVMYKSLKRLVSNNCIDSDVRIFRN
jgi:hypothetical protein